MSIFPFAIIMFLSSAHAYELQGEKVTPEKYQIQKSENLSSISKTMFGDAGYWPKIWSHSKLSNPRLLQSGHTIQFLLGNEEAAPAFSISESDDNFDTDTPQPLLQRAAAKTSTDVVIPPPKVRPKPVLKIPPSFPAWHIFRARKSRFMDYDVEVEPRPALNYNVSQIVSVYVDDQPVDPVGEYAEPVSETGLAYDGKEIFVRMKRGQGQLGQHYLLVNNLGRLQDSHYVKDGGGDYQGHVVEVQAEMILTDPAEVNSERGWDHFRAKVVKAIGLSLDGTVIIPGRLSWIGMGKNGPVATVNSHVIGGNYDERGLVMGAGNWVFLDKGSKDGLAVGQLTWATVSPHARDESSPYIAGAQQSALIKIANVASGVATGIILESRESVRQGDFTGSATATEASKGSNESDDLSNDVDDGTGLDPGTSDSGNGSSNPDQSDDNMDLESL